MAEEVGDFGRSSACRCGPKGESSHRMGACPHLFHACTDACGKFYAAAAKTGYAARRPDGGSPCR